MLLDTFSVPVLEVSAVAGFKAQLPCNIDPPTKDETVIMVFWYKDEKDGVPIYSMDIRGRQILHAKLWSDPYVFGERAVMKTNIKPAELEIYPLESTDGGVYRCRVDFKNSPTKNQKINLIVIGKYRLYQSYVYLLIVHYYFGSFSLSRNVRFYDCIIAVYRSTMAGKLRDL